MTHKGALIRIGAVLMMSGLLLTACSSSNSGSPSGNTTRTTTGSASTALAAAVAATTSGYTGTSTNVDPTSRPAAKNKTIVIISAGQAADSNAVPVKGAQEAAQAIGWNVSVYDAKLMPSNYADLVRQAIAAHANGIILDAIDCDTVKAPLEQAKAAGIAVTAMYAFDCNDPHAGGGTTSLFGGITNYGAKNSNLDAFTESYGSDQANYVIDKSNNTAKIIAIQDPEFTVLYYTLAGFAKTIAASHGSQIIATLDITQQDILDGNIVTKIQAELQRYPQANWIKSPFTYATTIGIVPALGSNPNHIQVMGGEGFHDELDDIRSGKITATNAISSDWTGWAAVDTLNSIFNHTKPVDSGIGWTLVDATHNLPTDPASDYIPPVDYKTEYKKAWGVAG
ncbi:MAG TPA: substrate-binding domain-containing protein [Acidimicrobiales bacterium]|nr:substrate-binding domain-containing protein [Acidimicrobiales bacterium]